MNFFQRLEASITAEYHKLLTPSVTSVIEGQIALVNLDPVSADKSGSEKHFLVAGIIASLFKIGEAIAHALVKIVFTNLQAKTPEVLKPFEQQIEEVAQTAVTEAATRLVSSPFVNAVPLTPPPSILQQVLNTSV